MLTAPAFPAEALGPYAKPAERAAVPAIGESGVNAYLEQVRDSRRSVYFSAPYVHAEPTHAHTRGNAGDVTLLAGSKELVTLFTSDDALAVKLVAVINATLADHHASRPVPGGPDVGAGDLDAVF